MEHSFWDDFWSNSNAKALRSFRGGGYLPNGENHTNGAVPDSRAMQRRVNEEIRSNHVNLDSAVVMVKKVVEKFPHAFATIAADAVYSGKNVQFCHYNARTGKIEGGVDFHQNRPIRAFEKVCARILSLTILTLFSRIFSKFAITRRT